MRITSPSVANVVQTFSWLFGSHDNPLTCELIFTVDKLIKVQYFEEAKTSAQQIQRVV